ncbi:uncharacterized protein STEHIDRAFT_114154 [Stereum hirsutum FP-91666 SS1]|uniref:uncharacterized protein n=1 Tax=Stereum hirsutum (strain FP-91666) TaxID=721885 RepID=UPI00044497BD|nr:uncharacterized protein STEHIDRAFT_114154 [Stereum hirsutum FP-91666 SS1]EIM83153.1 hypothetical protein STEHIDRAFT_114154 [Stereum hirsutum FP-91666 SS1]
MDNHAPPDAFLPVILTSKQAIEDISTVYSCLERFPPSNTEYLPNFRDLDLIHDKISVLHGSDSDFLVYNDAHERAHTEVTFALAGYISAFDLPGRGVFQRELHKPHTLKQRVTIVAPESSGFDLSMDALTSLGSYLEQFSTEGPNLHFKPRKVLNLSALEARCNLFSRQEESVNHPLCNLPTYMDPKGKLAAQIRRRSYCHTTDNVVQYAESDRPVTKEHGQLVVLNVVVRLVKANTSRQFSRMVEIVLRKLVLVGRTQELSLMKLRQAEKRRAASMTVVGDTITSSKGPLKRVVEQIETKEEYARARLASMRMDEDDVFETHGRAAELSVIVA